MRRPTLNSGRCLPRSVGKVVVEDDGRESCVSPSETKEV